MSPANYWKLGLFIVSCLTIALAMLAFLGAKQFDKEVEVVHYFFNEPVDGLTAGSEIRHRGIPIGSVTKVDLADDQRHVHAEGEVSVATLERLGLRTPGVENTPERMRKVLLESGMRAFLEQNILTGVSLINTDYFEAVVGTLPVYPFDTPQRTIPTAPSAFKGIMADLEGTLRWFRNELPETVESLRSLVRQLDRAVTDLDIAALSTEAQSTLASLREETGRLASSMGGALDDGQSFLARLRDKKGPLESLLTTYQELGVELRDSLQGLDLAKTQGALDRTLESFGETSQGVGALTEDLRDDLGQLGRTLESLQSLAELLERDPSALLLGREAGRSPLERKQP